jgi:hypothetical protein
MRNNFIDTVNTLKELAVVRDKMIDYGSSKELVTKINEVMKRLKKCKPKKK